MRLRTINLGFILHGGLILFLLLLLLESRNYPAKSSIYPQIVGGVTLALILFSFIGHFRTACQDKGDFFKSPLHRKRFLKISLVTVLATVLGFLGGIILSVFCYYSVHAMLEEKRRFGLPCTLGMGVALTFFFYIVFGLFMNIPMFQGWFFQF